MGFYSLIMALSVDYVYQYTLDLMNKNQAGSIDRIRWARHWNDSSTAYMDDLLGRFQSRSNGKSGINTGLIENETIMQKLAPFINNATINIAAGVGGKPAGFIYELALRINGKEVHHITHDQKAAVNDNVIDPPSIPNDKYYVVEYGGNYSFLPLTVTQAELDYVVAPTDVVWGFTLVSNRQVYDPGTSVQPQWDNNSCREITRRVLDTLGVSYKDADFANFGNRVVNTGN
jgi:hypothetical protein